MKMATTPSKIVGVQLGEVTVNFMRPDQPGLKAKFALLTKDGDVASFTELVGGWSDKAQEAARAFSEALEEEVLRIIFEQGQASETPQATATNEPPQF